MLLQKLYFLLQLKKRVKLKNSIEKVFNVLRFLFSIKFFQGQTVWTFSFWLSLILRMCKRKWKSDKRKLHFNQLHSLFITALKINRFDHFWIFKRRPAASAGLQVSGQHFNVPTLYQLSYHKWKYFVLQMQSSILGASWNIISWYTQLSQAKNVPQFLWIT